MTVDDMIATFTEIKTTIGGDTLVGIKTEKNGFIRFTDIVGVSASGFEGLNIEIKPIYDKDDKHK
jgi:hypothetical protein